MKSINASTKNALCPICHRPFTQQQLFKFKKEVELEGKSVIVHPRCWQKRNAEMQRLKRWSGE